MAKLAITSNQKTTIIDAIDADLEATYAEGVEVPGSPATPVLAAMDTYADPAKITPAMKIAIKDYARQLVAALIKRLGITGPLQAPAFVSGGITVTINYRKSDGVSNGTLTFTNGVLTAQT